MAEDLAARVVRECNDGRHTHMVAERAVPGHACADCIRNKTPLLI